MKPSTPADPDAQLARARAAFTAGDDEIALALVGPALAQRPDWPPALLLQANAGLRCGELDIGINALQKLCQRGPVPAALARALATAHNNRGSQRRRAGDEAAALRDFEAALALQPGHALAGFNRGLCLRALGRREEAEQALAAHLQASPQDSEAALEHALLTPDTPARRERLRQLLVQAGSQQQPIPAELEARVRLAMAQPGAALCALQHAPQDARAALAWSLGEALQMDNLSEDAAQAFELGGTQARARERLAAALVCRPVQDSAEAARGERERSLRMLAALSDECANGRPLNAARLEDLTLSHFLLAYQGQDDTALMAQLGSLVAHAARQLHPQWADPPEARHPRRVLLVGSLFRDCTAGAYFGGWINWLREAGLEVVVYQLGPRRDAETGRLADLADRFHFIDEDRPLNALAAQLRAESAGLLLYPELGMDARLYPLAALRLARRQAMAWGHPVSAGLDSLDAFCSCAEMEPADADHHYREPLRRLPGLGVDYRCPASPPPASRAELGLPERGALLLAPQSLFKLHPDNDSLYAEALERLPQAQLLLFDDRPAWREALALRLARAGVDPGRTHWLPTGSRARYLQINAACDLMLDSLHFSGGNASLDALQSGLPVLGTPGRFMRGRQSLAMLRRLGLEDRLCVAEPDHRAARAVELIRSGEAQALRPRILQGLPQLFEADDARRSFVAMVEGLLQAF
jgi:predicted O-linked N-acetylglucosamine transferase (SPINDLY family)